MDWITIVKIINIILCILYGIIRFHWLKRLYNYFKFFPARIKFIDNKGRVFGKISIIDTLVILTFIAIISGIIIHTLTLYVHMSEQEKLELKIRTENKIEERIKKEYEENYQKKAKELETRAKELEAQYQERIRIQDATYENRIRELSVWQEAVKEGYRLRFEEWLRK